MGWDGTDPEEDIAQTVTCLLDSLVGRYTTGRGLPTPAFGMDDIPGPGQSGTYAWQLEDIPSALAGNGLLRVSVNSPPHPHFRGG